MKCPVCTDVRMREVDKDGVLIDVCPDCKGVWLDRGELDKLMQGMRQMQDDYDRLEEQYYASGAPGKQPGPQGGYGAQQPPYGQPQRPQQPQQGYGQPYNGGHGQYGHGHGHKDGHGQYGYDKYGRPKKKKTMFDVLGDLFD